MNGKSNRLRGAQKRKKGEGENLGLQSQGRVEGTDKMKRGRRTLMSDRENPAECHVSSHQLSLSVFLPPLSSSPPHFATPLSHALIDGLAGAGSDCQGETRTWTSCRSWGWTLDDVAGGETRILSLTPCRFLTVKPD